MSEDPEVLFQRLNHAELFGLERNGMSAAMFKEKAGCGRFYVMNTTQAFKPGLGKVSGL